MSDAAIIHILGEVLGTSLTKSLDMQRYWDSQIDFEVLAGASMAAKRTMNQSMVMLTEFLQNPQLTQALADMGLYIDWEVIFKMWAQASEWKNPQDIVKSMPPDVKAKHDANSPAAIAQMRNQAQQSATDQKFQQKQELEDQSTNNRIKRDLVIASAKASGLSETVLGEPSTAGLGGQEPTVM
jgi:hypothetical protein